MVETFEDLQRKRLLKTVKRHDEEIAELKVRLAVLKSKLKRIIEI